MDVGVIEILSDSVRLNCIERTYEACFRKQFASIMPQAVAVWCRELGHKVWYATYYGQQDPRRLLPKHLDVVFIATCTHASALAYALARCFRLEKTLTVVGGAHAKAFAEDCLRFFDIVVQQCNKTAIKNILDGHYPPRSIVDCPPETPCIPSVESRRYEIETSQFWRKRPTRFSWIPIMASIGCPYHCDFCTDWDTPYHALQPECLRADLEYIAKRLPGVLIQYHDPNFGVRFDSVMETIESIPSKNQNPYSITCSLSVLKTERMQKLAETNCVFVLIGLESWQGYSQKAGIGCTTGETKLAKIASHLKELNEYVPYIQVTLLFGTDVDIGEMPIRLTKALIKQIPTVWPVINTPIPFGGTPLFERYLKERRVLETMPFSFYKSPYLPTILKNYEPEDYYSKWIDLLAYQVSPCIVTKQLCASGRSSRKLLLAIRIAAARYQLYQLRRIKQLMDTDASLVAFHEGRQHDLPKLYKTLYCQKLGRYSSLMSDKDMVPRL
jgi:radical SAM superfamily enzyme YgiQ (UPF0313 family)